MENQLFQHFAGRGVTDAMLEEAAQLFNEHYGTWGEDPTNHRSNPKPGKSFETISISIL